MPVELGAAEAVVKLRMPPSGWIPAVCMGFLIAYEGFFFARTSLLLQAVGFVLVAWGVLLRRYGVDLTPESVNVHGILRRNIPWLEVQAVVDHQLFRHRSVRLILRNGNCVRLRAPTTTIWWLGDAGYERDFHRIAQWWVANRGPSWRPIHPEPLRPPV